MNTAVTATAAADRATILIVDDTPDNIMLLSRLLKDKYNTKVATGGTLALQIAQATPGTKSHSAVWSAPQTINFCGNRKTGPEP